MLLSGAVGTVSTCKPFDVSGFYTARKTAKKAQQQTQSIKKPRFPFIDKNIVSQYGNFGQETNIKQQQLSRR